MRKKTGTTKYLFVFVLLLFCYYMYSIYQIYSFELIPDEFGYWTYAATLSGCDWSDIVSLGSYYSFGYTLILYPIGNDYESIYEEMLELQRQKRNRMIWGSIIVVLVIAIFGVGIVSAVKKNREEN